ncbi:hypothetical protein [Desertivirga arenae]|uniref:hypothetical protein n=1 Tax=Desertivirga arenae TaxID=2810309 RepID=UPI001A95D242|nr:hypothetical protein [Pedobacter sp. SYSU D00823]
MSFLKALLNPFVEFEEDKSKQVAKNNPLQAPPPTSDKDTTHPLIDEPGKGTAAASVPPTTSQAASAIIRQSDTMPFPEHTAYFEALLDKANRENPAFTGPDFKEFIEAKLDIDDIADENLRYVTAFNILKNAGLSKERLISTGHEYQNVIGRDLNAFQTAHARQYKAELEQKELDLQKKAEELRALTQRLNVLKGEINQISQEITTKKDSLNATRSSFLLAGENMQKEIQLELEKIMKYFG